MQKLLRIVPVVATVLAACGGGDGGGSGGGGTPASPSTVSSLAGSWKATRAEFVSASNSSQRVEVCAKGTTLALTLDPGGTYTQKITDPGQAGQTTTGTWSATKEVLSLKPAGMIWAVEFDFNLAGNTLTLNGGHVLFDVNGDGQDEESLAYFTLARQ
jgi:hypothetical protein